MTTDAALTALQAHMKLYRGQVLTTTGTFVSEEFDRLYHVWICARWDDGDPWVRRVWATRPAEPAVGTTVGLLAGIR